jgi:thioredoxin 2
MSTSLTIVCPKCDALNRVPQERLAESRAAVCGKCRAKLFPGTPIGLDHADRFQKHAERGDLPLLVDFWAPWCGPCRMMAPEFEKAAGALEPRVRLAKVDTEAVPALGIRFGIQTIPTMILFQRGREIARQSGAMQVPGIMRIVEAALAKDSETRATAS